MSKKHISWATALVGAVVIFIIGFSTANSDLLQGKTRNKLRTDKENTKYQNQTFDDNQKETKPSGSNTIGKITVASAWNEIYDDKIVAGVQNEPVAHFRLFANGEDFVVEEMTFENDSANDNAYESDAIIQQLDLWYPDDFNDSNTTAVATAPLVNGIAHFTGLSIAIPASEVDENSRWIELRADTNILSSARNSGWQIEMDFNEGEDFKAVGQTSLGLVTHASGPDNFGTTYDVDAHEMALYQSIPEFQTHPNATPCISLGTPGLLIESGDTPVYCFSVAADPSGDVGMYKLTLEVNPLGLDTADWLIPGAFQLLKYNPSGTVMPAPLALGTWDPSTNLATLTFSAEEIVLAGNTNYYLLQTKTIFDPTWTYDPSLLSVRLSNEVGPSYEHLPETTAAAAQGRIIWSDRSTAGSSSTNQYTMPDWTNSYKLETLPSLYMFLTSEI